MTDLFSVTGFKPSKVQKKKSSKRKKLAPVLPFSTKDVSDSIIYHQFNIENEANKKKMSPDVNLPSCSKINVYDNFATNSSSDNIPETHKECDNSQIESIRNLDSYSPIVNRNLHKKFCDNLGTPVNNIPPLSSTPYRKSRLLTYIQDHDLSAISTSENSSQGKTNYYSINSLKKVEEEARSISTSCNKIKDEYFKNHQESNDEGIDFKMSSEPFVDVTNIFTDPLVDVTDIFTDPFVNVTDMFAQPVMSRKSQKIKDNESSILSENEDKSANVTDTLAQPEPRNVKRINYNESSILTESEDESPFSGFHLNTKENESETLFFGFPSKNNSGQGSPILFGSTISDSGCNESQVVLGRSENNKLTHLILSNTDKVVDNTFSANELTSFNESQHLNNLTDVFDGMNSSIDSSKHNLTGKHSTNSVEYNLFNDSKLAKVPIVVLTKLDSIYYDRVTGNLSKSFELESNSNNTSEIDLEANNFNPLYSTGGNVDAVLDASELSRLSSEKIQIEKDDCNISQSNSENVEMTTNISKILCLSTKTLEKDNNDSKKNCMNNKDIEKVFTDSKLSNSNIKNASKSTQNSPKCDTAISNKMSDVSKSSSDKLKENLEPNKQSVEFVRKIVDSPIVLRNKKTVYRGQAHKSKKPARKATKSTSLDKKMCNENKISSAEIIQLETLEGLVKTQETFEELEVNKSFMVDKITDEISILDATDYSAINKGENQFVSTRSTASSQYSVLDISAFSCLNRTQDSPNISIEYDRTVSEENFGNSRDTFFNPRETFSNIQQMSFNKRETFYNKRETTSNTRETFSNKQQTSFNKRETFSDKGQTSLNKRETFSNKRQTSFNKRETFYNKRDTFSNRRETFYNNDEFSSRPSIVLEPGKRWERSLRILRNLNRSNMTLDDTVDSCNATIQENLHPKGRKYTESVAHLIELQSKDGIYFLSDSLFYTILTEKILHLLKLIAVINNSIV